MIGIALCLIVPDYKVRMIGSRLLVESSGLWTPIPSLHETTSVAITQVITLKFKCSFSDAIPRNKAERSSWAPSHKQPVSLSRSELLPVCGHEDDLCSVHIGS